MICRTCLRAARAPTSSSIIPRSSIPRSQFEPQFTRFLSTTRPAAHPTTPATNTTAPNPQTEQPLSAPLTPAPSSELKEQANKATQKKAATTIKSSVPAGTPLKGLNFFKGQEDPVALPDDEYPAWLWTLLGSKEAGKKGEGVGDLFSKSKKQRRLAAKRLRKEQAANPDMLIPKIPLYEQTIDLPAGDGTLEGAIKAKDARGGLTKAMRNKRRANIKERNFLQSMG